MSLPSTNTPKADPFAGAARLATPGAWLRFAEKLYAREKLALGQVATDAHDEALYLILWALHAPLDSDARILTRKLTRRERDNIEKVLRRRVQERQPAAYITSEAWLGEHRFHVDPRVIIPRSYFVEIIRDQLDGWLRDPRAVRRVADVCTGSGCLAILLAHHFPKARIDAIDLSESALAVAELNVRAHQLSRRVKLHRADVLQGVPAAKYDLIVCNPPYEPSAHVNALPLEFQREPRMSLDGGADGLDIIRRLLRQAKRRLTREGLVLIEVGGLREAMDREFAALEPHWLQTEDGADCVCVIHAARLR
jgi:ribosomal protein L3 glutamine methyltransferase